MKDRVTTLGIAALAAVATAGWTRQPVTPVSAFGAPEQAVTALDPLTVQTIASPLPLTVRNGVYRETGAPVPRAQQRPVQTASRNHYQNDPESRADDRDYERNERPATIVKERSTAKSAAIIGGSAAAGAAIGALAGGGKGAAIGALSGGVAGVVYDRMTHKKRVPLDE